MTPPAPRERTRPAVGELHTPVTLAPDALAICTANDPTPPAAPMTITCCPAARARCRALPAAPSPQRSALPPPARTTGRPARPPAGLLQCGRVLGERAALAGPVHLVPGTEAGHAGAGRRRHPGHVTAADLNRGREAPTPGRG